MTISKMISVDYAHFLESHSGKCRGIHGHRANIVATFGNENLVEEGSSTGMVEDFGIIGLYMKQEIFDIVDHGFLINTSVIAPFIIDFLDTHLPSKIVHFGFPTTSEALAQWSFSVLQNRLSRENSKTKLLRVEWWETPNSHATFGG